MDKINFAGGEPFLHPRLPDYCKAAKDLGMTVSITTNGSLLNRERIRCLCNVLDWIALSIDSGSNEIERLLGRGFGDHVSHCLEVAGMIREAGIRLKMNTTVTALTYQENMITLAERIKPDRWKVLQMMHICGENDGAVEDLTITSDQFGRFVERHRRFVLNSGEMPVFESCDAMENSYFMITPGGNVKTDTGNVISKFSLEEIISCGVDHFVSTEKYQNRGGIYEWNTKRNTSGFRE